VLDSTRKKPRHECVSEKFSCYQAWKQDANEVKPIMKNHVEGVKLWIEQHRNVDCDKAFEQLAASTVTPGVSTPEEPTADKDKADDTTKKERNINYWHQEISSNGKQFKVKIPRSHKLVYIPHLKAMENKAEVCDKIRSKLQQKQHTARSPQVQALWAVAMAAVPALALSAAQCLIPIIIAAFLCDAGIMDDIPTLKFAQSFPSDNTLRRHNLLQAVRDTMSLGHSLLTAKIFLACDKGNKRGIGHFVKMLSWWFLQLIRMEKPQCELSCWMLMHPEVPTKLAHKPCGHQ